MMSKERIISMLVAFSFLSVPVSTAYGEEAVINLQNNGHHDHLSIPFVPADMPQVYYDSEAGVITVDGPGYASYYYVDIVSQSTLSVVLYDTVDGDYGTVDVSSLPDDNYTIIITSSNNNEYTGQFTNY